MINIQKQIEYWTRGAEDDLKTEKILINEKRTLHGLFFCHLVIEKTLKAHVVKHTSLLAPKSHNLIFLLDKTEIELSEQNEIFLGILMKYQLQGRYPDYNPVLPDDSDVQSYLLRTEELMTWLIKKL